MRKAVENLAEGKMLSKRSSTVEETNGRFFILLFIHSCPCRCSVQCLIQCLIPFAVFLPPISAFCEYIHWACLDSKKTSRFLRLSHELKWGKRDKKGQKVALISCFLRIFFSACLSTVFHDLDKVWQLSVSLCFKWRFPRCHGSIQSVSLSSFWLFVQSDRSF